MNIYIHIYIYIYIYGMIVHGAYSLSIYEFIYTQWCIMYVTWLNHTCDMTPLYIWHDLFMYVWLIHVCLPHACMSASFMYVCLIHVCLPHSCMSASFVYVCLVHVYLSHSNQSHSSRLERMARNESCHTHEWVMSHMRMSPVTHVNGTNYTCERVMSHVWTDGSRMTWLIHVCDTTHPCVWHDSFMYVIRLIHVCDMTHSCMWHDSFMCVTWLIYVCDTTHSCVWHDSFICQACWLLTYVKNILKRRHRHQEHWMFVT